MAQVPTRVAECAAHDVKAIVRAADQQAFIVSHPLGDAEGGVVKRSRLH
jgi:hypothetical protein